MLPPARRMESPWLIDQLENAFTTPSGCGESMCECDPCFNGASCVYKDYCDYACQCAEGWEGKHCAEPVVPPDDLAWVAGVVIGAILLLGIIAFIFVRRKRSRYFTTPSGGKKSALSSQDSPETRRGGEMLYDNVAFEDIGDNDGDLLRYKIPLSATMRTYRNMAQENDDILNQEFRHKLVDEVKKHRRAALAAKDSDNASLNRFINIFPYDYNRVKLDSEANDYVNASYIDGYYEAKKFIASQGPLPATVDHFWSMIWQERSSIIVMLTNPVEKGKRKCEEYWPGVGEKAKYGSVKVEAIEEKKFPSYVLRKFNMTNEKNVYEPVRELSQFHFVVWPDHGVPDATTGFLRLHKHVTNEHTDANSTAPIVVHCSAGVGRTGTFIGFDNLRAEMKDTSEVNVFKCVLEMRRQRPEMVQSAAQYLFLHKLVAEVHLLGETDFDVSQIYSKIERLDKLGSDNKAGYLLEFKKLETVTDTNFDEDDSDDSSEDEDYEIILPATAHHKETSYSGAIITMSCLDKVMAVKGPSTKQSVENFWRLVCNAKSQTIVKLGPVGEKNAVGSPMLRYWPGEVGGTSKFGEVGIELLSEVDEKNIVERKIKVLSDGKELKVTQFQLTDWKDKTRPGVGEIIRLAYSVQNQSDEGSVLIHCVDGCGRSGTFIAAMELIEAVKSGRVDVCRTVKDLRDEKEGMVSTAEQYRFLYDVVQRAVEDSSTDENSCVPLTSF